MSNARGWTETEWREKYIARLREYGYTQWMAEQSCDAAIDAEYDDLDGRFTEDPEYCADEEIRDD